MNYGAEVFPYEPSTEFWARVGGLMFLYTSKCLCIGKTISYMCESGHNVFAYLSFSFFFFLFTEVCCSVSKSCPTLCNPMACSTPDSPVFYYLPEFAQTHVYWVSDAVQPPHPLSPPSPLALGVSQHQGLFQWAGSSHHRPKYWSFSFYWRMRACLVTSVISDSLEPHRL